MKFISLLFLLTSLSAAANNPNQTDQTDAFNSALFGEEETSPSMQAQEEEAPTWVTPTTTPERQEMQETPVHRLNQWQEQGQRASEGEEL